MADTVNTTPATIVIAQVMQGSLRYGAAGRFVFAKGPVEEDRAVHGIPGSVMAKLKILASIPQLVQAPQGDHEGWWQITDNTAKPELVIYHLSDEVMSALTSDDLSLTQYNRQHNAGQVLTPKERSLLPKKTA